MRFDRHAPPATQDAPAARRISVASCGCDGGNLWIRLHDASGAIFAVAIVPRRNQRPLLDDIALQIAAIEAGRGGECGHG